MKLLAFVLGFLLAATAQAWATGSLIPNGEQTFTDSNGNPLASGYVYMYVPGTTTPKNTWQDQNLTVLNTNPIRLDSSGRAIIWGAAGNSSYRQVVQDQDGNLIWDQITATAAGNVTGPATSTVGDVVLWGNTTGTLLSDGGAPTQVSITDSRFGGVCDGSTDTSAAFNAAAASFGGKGGVIFVPAVRTAGQPCVIANGITLPANVTIEGVPLHYWSGTTFNAPSDWARAGSWIQCTDTINPCIKFTSVGNLIKDINFIYAQPAPTGTWTPTTYPYTISIQDSANFWGLSNISITAATHCIDITGQTTGIAGINAYMQNIYFNGCFNSGTRFTRVDNEIRVNNLYYYPWWYADNSAVLTYIQANKIDWDVNYLANIQGSNIIFGRSKLAIQLKNGTVNSGFGAVTFAGNDWQISNVSFNFVCQAVAMPNGNGTVSTGVKMTNIVAYTDSTTSCGALKSMFDLPSDQADWALDHLRGGYVDTLASIGAGTAGTLKLADVDVAEYSHYTAAQPALKVSANADLQWWDASLDGLRPAGSAGPKVGPGVSGQGYMAPYRVGTDGGIEGIVVLEGSRSASFSGDVAFYMPDGTTRTGYIGRSSASLEVNIVADAGDVNLTPGSSKIINLLAPTKLKQYTVGTLTACNATTDGTTVMISDLNGPVYGAAPVGGGALRGTATCTNGTGWLLQ